MSKRPTKAKPDPLAHSCPKCHARAGDPCVDPLGDPTPGVHKVRGPGKLEQHIAEGIARKAARERAEYGPLFQHVAEAEVKMPTVAEVKARARLAAARAFDEPGPSGQFLLRQCNKGMEWLAVRHMAREMERLAGAVGRELAEHAMRTYPLGYQRMTFRELMTTTKAKQVGPYRVPADNSLGFTIAYRHTWAPAAPLMTREEFDRRFALPDHLRGLADAPEPDDGGLFARVTAACAPRA